MEILMLGTSSMVPTKERNHSSLLIYHEKDSVLFDCGEGTQRQMKIAGVDINRITKIFITHWHGDHVLGLPGLVQTMGAQNYDKTLHIYGPKGSKKHFEHLLKAFEFDIRIEIEVHDVEEGIAYKSSEYNIESLEMKHPVPTVGYALVENPKRKMNMTAVKKLGIPKGPLLGKLQDGHNVKFEGKEIKSDDVTTLVPGKKVTYVTDTGFCTNAVKLAENSDLLICEATFLSEKEDKAEDYMHLTANQSAQIASRSNSKKLLLTHFSARYKTTHELEEDAKAQFENTVCAYDFMKVKV